MTFPFSKTLQQFHIDLLTYEQEILDALLLLSPLLNDKSSPINMYISVYMHLLTDRDPTHSVAVQRDTIETPQVGDLLIVFISINDLHAMLGQANDLAVRT